MFESNSISSYVNCNGVDIPYTSYRRLLDLDRTPKRRRKRTSGYSLKANSLAGKAVISYGANGGVAYGRQFPYEIPLIYDDTPVPFERLEMESAMIIDWDTGIERVFPDKIEQFNFVSQAFEFAELKTLGSSFAFRALSFYRDVLAGATSIVLLNNLVVVPTMMSLRDFFAAKGDLYEKAIKRLEELQVPTKFSCKPIYRTKVFNVDHVLFPFFGDIYKFNVVVTERISVKIKKRGTGILSASPNINRILLSSMTSGFHIDLQSVWDRIPLSFIIDYFFGIGEVLGQDRIDICQFTADSCSEQTEVTVKSSFRNIRLEPVPGFQVDPNVTVKFEYPGYQDFDVFTRNAFEGTSQPVFDGLDPRQIYVSGDTSLSQILNTLLITLGFFHSGVDSGASRFDSRTTEAPRLRGRRYRGRRLRRK